MRDKLSRNWRFGGGRRIIIDSVNRVLALLLAIFGCSPSPSPTNLSRPAPSSSQRHHISILAPVRTVDPGGGGSARRDLASRIESSTGFDVSILDTSLAKDRESGEVEAALHRAEVLVHVYFPQGSPGNYVAASAYVVVTSQLLGDTAASYESTGTIVGPLSDWVASLAPSINELKPFDSVAFVQRLEKANRCSDVVHFAAQFEPKDETEKKELDRVNNRCDQRVNK